VKDHAGLRPIRVLCVHLFFICVESCLLVRMPRRSVREGRGVGRPWAMARCASWCMGIAAAVAAGVPCDVAGAQVQGVLPRRRGNGTNRNSGASHALAPCVRL